MVAPVLLPYRFTDHARARCVERGIREEEVEAVLATPTLRGVAFTEKAESWVSGPRVIGGRRGWLTVVLVDATTASGERVLDIVTAYPDPPNSRRFRR